MAEIDDHITTSLQAIEIEGKSAKTIASYANTLADFRNIGRRLGFPERPEDYRVQHVYAFLSELRTRGASAAYQHRRHREMKACFSWLRSMDVIEQNVFTRVPMVKQPIVIKEPFNVQEVMKLLASENPATYVGCRNRALVLFFLDTGIRASECIALELADLDWDRQRALVRHGKGDKQRRVGFSKPTGDMVREYIARFRGEEPGALFLTSRQAKMRSGNALNWILRRLSARTGVAHVNPHRFRHTFATWAIESGAREIDVQMLLGHTDLTMTHHYARRSRFTCAHICSTEARPELQMCGSSSVRLVGGSSLPVDFRPDQRIHVTQARGHVDGGDRRPHSDLPAGD
jgi:site-specific recombinase XerD